MSDHPPYHISSLAMMLFGLSAMLDTGKQDDITLEEVKQHARDGDLFDFLQTLAGGSFAMNLHEAHPGFARWYVAQIAANCEAMEGRERRKYGVEQRGLCLLVSYTAEIIQQGDNIRLK